MDAAGKLELVSRLLEGIPKLGPIVRVYVDGAVIEGPLFLGYDPIITPQEAKKLLDSE